MRRRRTYAQRWRAGDIFAVRAFGWQLDYRPDGWLPLGVREGWAREPRWHVLRLGRYGCVTLGRVVKLG